MLKKMKMPKPKEFDVSELDMEESDVESPEYEASEPQEEEMDESAEKESDEQPSELEQVSDEDLLAEVKKRGLLSQLESETSEESAEDAYL
jgi:hypothetical protein